MKRSNVIITNLLILACGILFLAIHPRQGVLELIILASGVLFLVIAGMNSIYLARDGRRATAGREHRLNSPVRMLSWGCCIAAIILGAIMIVKTHLFVTLYVYIFAVALFLGGCYHIYMLARGLKPVSMPFWLYLLPIAMIACGVILFINPGFADSANHHLVIMITGIGLTAFAVATFTELLTASILRRRLRTHAEPTSAEPASEIPAETTTDNPSADPRADTPSEN